jgi:probable F420-dependent oxidoreductase
MTNPRPFRFGAHANVVSTATEWRDIARKVEDLGYCTLFVSDHYLDRGIPPAAIMYVAPITAMATAAAVTTTLRVGCRVFCIDYHVPAALAKEAATLDMLSDGRLEFGIGAGWSAHEYESMGLDFDGAPQRVTKLEEVVALLKAHWSGDVMDIAGEYVKVSGYAGLPLPVQRPNPPLMIGGGKKRVLSLAAREADIVSISNVPFLAVNDAGLDPMGEAARRLGYVRDAAGDRFAGLDIESSPYYAKITDDLETALTKIAGMLKAPPEVLDDHPNVLVGTVDQVADALVLRREITGINYVTVPQGLIDSFAPVAALLNGK